MTIREMLDLFRSGIKETQRLRYKVGTTDSDGATDGTTIVDSDFGAVDDAYNNAEVRITSGDANGQRRKIGDYVGSTGAIAVIQAFTDRIASGVTFEVGERGFVSDHQAIELFTDGQNDLLDKLPVGALKKIETNVLDTGSGGLVDIPANIIGLPHDVLIDSKSVIMFEAHEEDRFDRTSYLGTTDEPIGIWQNGQLKYKPTSETAILFKVIAIQANTSFASGSPMPAYLHHLQVKYAIARGWLIKQKLDLHKIHKGEYDDLVKIISTKYGGL